MSEKEKTMPIPYRCTVTKQENSRDERKISKDSICLWRSCYTEHDGEMPTYDQNRRRALAKDMSFATLWKLYNKETDLCGKKILHAEIEARIAALPYETLRNWPHWANLWRENLPPQEFQTMFTKKLSEWALHRCPFLKTPNERTAEYLGL